jgi:hypothetical protein
MPRFGLLIFLMAIICIYLKQYRVINFFDIKLFNNLGIYNILDMVVGLFIFSLAFALYIIYVSIIVRFIYFAQ